MTVALQIAGRFGFSILFSLIFGGGVAYAIQTLVRSQQLDETPHVFFTKLRRGLDDHSNQSTECGAATTDASASIQALCPLPPTRLCLS